MSIFPRFDKKIDITTLSHEHVPWRCMKWDGIDFCRANVAYRSFSAFFLPRHVCTKVRKCPFGKDFSEFIFFAVDVYVPFVCMYMARAFGLVPQYLCNVWSVITSFPDREMLRRTHGSQGGKRTLVSPI